jgi:hypothetical protein
MSGNLLRTSNPWQSHGAIGSLSLKPAWVQHWLLTMVVVLLGLNVAQAQQTVTIGSTALPAASSDNTFYGPIYRFSATSANNRSRYAYLYTAAELGIPVGSVITNIAWLKSDANTAAGANTFNVLLKTTTATSLAAGTTWTSLTTGATSSYSSTAQAITGAAGTYFAVPLSTTFTYTGNNLLVLADWIRGGTTSGYLGWVPNAAPGLGIGNIGGATSPTTLGSAAGTYDGARPTIRITFTAPSCAGTPTAGTTVAAPANGCGSVSTTLSLSGATVANGLSYQWQSSATGAAGSYSNISGATNATYSATGLTSTTYFQAVVTCSGQSATSTPTVVQVYSNTPNYATLPVTESFESWVGRCGNTEVPGLNWRTTPLTGDNSWRRNDQGYSTAGWRYIADDAASYPAPVASTGSYSARFHTYGTNAAGQGSLDLFADLSAAGTKTLTFDYYNRTGTDQLVVLLSTDGGATFPTTLLTLNTSSAFSGQSVTFPATSATSVIRFRATSDFGDDDIGIDNLRLDVTPACPGVAFSPTTAITSSSATVNFAAVAGATSYTLTYSPGGSPQTVTNAGAVPLSGLQPYTTYTVTVTTNCGGQSGTSTTSFQTAIGNNDCAGAVTLTPGAAGDPCAPVTYTTAGATASTGVTANACGGTADDDVWFKFVAAGPRHSITVTPTYNFDPVVELRGPGTTCPGTYLNCEDSAIGGGTAGTETLVASGLTVGSTYFVRVYNYDAGSGSSSFDICVTTPPNLPCAQVTNANVNPVGTTTGTLNFTAAAGASDYYLTLAPTSGGTASTATLTGSPVSLTGLTANTSYTITIETNCSNGGVSAPVTVTFTTNAPPAPPANDNCSGAVVLTPGVAGAACSPTSGTVAGATQSLAAITCASSTAATAQDVWYRFVATNTTHTISIVGNFDGVLDVRTGANCTSTTNVGCADGFSNNETLTLTTLTVGTTYYVRYYPYTATPANGAFTICVTTPGGAPANDNCSGATVLTVQTGSCTAPTTGTNVDATDSGVADPACSSYLGGDVWYRFVVPAGGAVVVETGQGNGTSLSDTGLALYSGSCGSLTEIGCDDDSGTGAFSSISLTGLTPGATIYARVFDYDNAESGQFTICVSTPSDLTVSTTQSANGTYNNVTVLNGGRLSLSGDLTFTGTLTVQDGGTLVSDCNTTLMGSGNFVLAAGATLEICDAIGLAAAGNTSSFLQTTGSRSFSDDASYVYNGIQSQVTGSALPARVRNLTVNNSLGLTLSQALSVAQVARLQSGNLTTGPNAFTLLSSASGTALVDNSGGTVVGTGTMQRAITSSITGPAYRHLSSPVQATTVNDLATPGFAPVVNPAYNTAPEPNLVTPFPTVFGYDESRIASVTSTYGAFDKGWVSPASLTAPLTPTRGYTVNAPATATPMDFVGTFNNAAQASGPLSRGTDAQAGYHLLGNPYPAPLDWSTVGAAQRPGVDATMYVYESTGQYTGTFRTYINGVGGGSPLIAAGSGYFVHVSTPGVPGAVNLTNANRVTTWAPQPTFGRGTADTRPQLQLQVSGAGGQDQAFVYFQNGATTSVDAEYDGLKMPNTTGLNLASLVGMQALAINGLPALAANIRETVVPLTLAAPAAGSFTFEVTGLSNFGSTDVYLRDALTRTQQLLMPGSTYRFSIASAMEAERRFSLAFRPTGALATAPAFEAGLVSVFPNPTQGKFTVQLPPVAGQREVKAALLNVLGQTVSARTIALTTAGATAVFDTPGLAKGVYVLRLTAGTETVTQRVVVE